jgi:hypothetical protein
MLPIALVNEIDSLLHEGTLSQRMKWTPLVGRPIGLNKLVGLAARETPIGLARPLQLLNLLMC